MTLNNVVLDNQYWIVDANILVNFLEEEIFFELINLPPSVKSGAYVTNKEDEMRIKIALTDNRRMALFFTTKENSRLTIGKIGGVSLRAAIQMTIDNPELDGLLLHSDQEVWRAVTKDGLRYLLQVRGQT